MRFYDIYNGDADGLCAPVQLRLSQPRDASRRVVGAFANRIAQRFP